MTQPSEERYASLLQPIRDLAANWSVNIANELEDYLEVLDGVQFSFSDGGPSLNFAEAALLIQGSACIYSKKVEYLHTLVYQALEFIAERRKRDGKGAREGGEEGGAGGQADDDDEFDDEEQFLSLDDVLEEGSGIDLDEDAAVQLQVAVRPPAALLALEDTGTSHGGDGDAGNYRIASCAVHRSGALLLEQRDGAGLDEHLQPVSSQVGGGCAAAAATGSYWHPTTAAAAAQPASGAGPAAAPGDDQDMADWGGGGGGFSDDDDDGGFGGGMDDWGPEPGHVGRPEGPAGDSLHQRQGGARLGPGGGEPFDPYKPLDPNSRGALKVKPFKKAARVARKPKARQQERRPPPVAPDALLTLQAPAAGLLFPEFAYALKQQEGPKALQQRAGAGASRTTSQRSAQTTAAAFTFEEAVAGFGADPEDDDHDAGDFYDGGAGFGDDGDDDGFAPLADLAMPDMLGGPPAAAAAAAVLEADWGGSGGDGFAAGGADELTYEELCRAHIEAFISAAAAAEVQTELAARVSGWRSKMAPMLEEEDARPEFDIHAYGDRFLQRMAELSCAEDVSAEEMRRGELEPLTFGQVVGVGLKYEASRTFASMLQLVNNGNVRIAKLGGGQEEGQFTLTLLDRVLPHKKVTDYRALGGAAAQQQQEQQDAAKAAAAEEGSPRQENQQQPKAAAKGGSKGAAGKAKAGGKAKRQKA